MQTLTMTLPMSDTPDSTPASSSVDLGPSQDRVAFTILVREHHRHLLAYARALLQDSSAASDLVQEALLVAYRRLGAFNPKEDFAAWVRGIIRNKWRELARQRRWELLPDEMLEGLDAQHSAWSYAVAEAKEQNPLFAKLDTCLQKLPSLLREAVDACYYQAHNAEETASVTGANAATIRKRLERARSALRHCIESPDGLLPTEA
jgi:RNA polymerase sigma-70 factor (ECF subfamily)